MIHPVRWSARSRLIAVPLPEVVQEQTTAPSSRLVATTPEKTQPLGSRFARTRIPYIHSNPREFADTGRRMKSGTWRSKQTMRDMPEMAVTTVMFAGWCFEVSSRLREDDRLTQKRMAAHIDAETSHPRRLQRSSTNHRRTSVSVTIGGIAGIAWARWKVV